MTIRHWSRGALSAALIALLGSCGPPSLPKETKAAIKKLPRDSYGVQIPDAGTVSYLYGGDRNGRRVIWVHGTPGEADGFGEFLLNVPKGYEYISIDRPGFGKSEPRGSVPSLERQAQAIAPLLERRNGQWPILVGHSLGGPIIAQVAADYPGKVGGLLILAGALDPGQEKVLIIQRFAQWGGARWMVPRMMKNSNQELIPLKGQLQALEPKLASIKVPIGIVHGTKDTLVPYANVPFMQAHFTGAGPLDIVTLQGENHFLPWKDQQVIKDALARLMQRVEAGAER